MAMYVSSRNYEKSDRKDKSHKLKNEDRERRHKKDEKKSKRHRSRSRSRDYNHISKVYYDRDNADGIRDEKHCKRYKEYVDKSKNNNNDYNDISERKPKSRNKDGKSHKKRRRHSSSDSQTKKASSPEMSDMELLEHLRIRRAQLLTELAKQENEASDIKPESPNSPIESPPAETIKFDSFAATDDIVIIDEPKSNVCTESMMGISEPTTEVSKSVTVASESVTEVAVPDDENDFDMFGDNFTSKPKASLLNDSIVENHRLHDNWDDHEGYYKVRLGEVIDGRYSVFKVTGKGVFSVVVKARDIQDKDREVAIKVIRNNDMMYRAGLKEEGFLRKINDLDKADKYHCVRLLRSFMHKNHLCLVFECLDMNLRDVVKKYGRNVGLNIKAIMSYAQQMLLSLRLIKKAGLIHGDIKPDNILANENKSVLKLSDFGSATRIEENEPTEYLASRFYRAPEVVLGLPYDYAVDLWAVGVTLYELYTGQIMFPGQNNNDMLRLMMEAKGRLPNKMVRRAEYCREKYFDDQFNFLQREVDKITEMEKVRVVRPAQPKMLDYDMFLRTKEAFDHHQDDHKVRQLRDLVDKMVQLDPNKRISVVDALAHPFITEPITK